MSMVKIAFIALMIWLVGLALILAWHSDAEAQVMSTCGLRAEVEARLQKQYGETQRGFGLNEQRNLVFELFFNDKTDTWTIFGTRTNGVACIGASGNGWTTVPAIDLDETPS